MPFTFQNIISQNTKQYVAFGSFTNELNLVKLDFKYMVAYLKVGKSLMF